MNKIYLKKKKIEAEIEPGHIYYGPSARQLG